LIPLLTGCRIDSGAGTFTDTLEIDAQETTLEEAADTFGVIIPMPDYLPEDYSVQEVYLLNAVYHKNGRVRLLISKEEIEKELVTQSGTSSEYQVYEFQCPMTIEIFYKSDGIPGGLKFTGGGSESVEITPRQGSIMGSLIADKESHNELWWEWRPDDSYDASIFQIGISASQQISKEEMIKVAESFEYQVSNTDEY
jgi:hypothetical protein